MMYLVDVVFSLLVNYITKTTALLPFGLNAVIFLKLFFTAPLFSRPKGHQQKKQINKKLICFYGASDGVKKISILSASFDTAC